MMDARIRPLTKHINVAAIASFSFALAALPALAQEQKRSEPKYPHVSLSTWYQVDPAWPRRPERFTWGEMPGVAIDDRDQVWIYTRAVPPVQAYATDGTFLRAWGEDEIKTAHHIKFDRDGNVWVADIGNHIVMQFSPEGKLLKTLGTRGEAGADSTHFDQPTDMAITPSGDVFVADGYGNNRVVHIDKNGKYVGSWGRLGTGRGEFSIPHAIALDSRGRVYVADRNNTRIQVFDQGGQFLDEWRDIIVPWGFCVTKNDEIWVCGSSPMPWRRTDEALGCPPKDQIFVKFDVNGKVLQLWTVPKGTDGREQPGDCNWVHGVAVDSQGNIYATDIIGKRAQKFVKQPPGSVSTR
jgi:NHL repeat